MARIELNSQLNNNCEKKCNKEARKNRTENDLCKGVKSVHDGLSVRCVGEWAEQKIYLLYQYFGIFTKGMKDKWQGKLNYIEICSGPGRCINRENGNEFDGTSLNILKHEAFVHLNKALFFDLSTTVVQVLNQRIAQLGVANAKAFVGDYNKADELCAVITGELSRDSLNIVFIDPTDCSVPFSLIRKIKETLPNVDFIINVATGTDFTRNMPMAFDSTERAEKYCRFLGRQGFFVDPANIEICDRGDFNNLRNKFRMTYQQSLAEIGYQHFDVKTIVHYYDILFAAGHKTAIDFWKKATAIKYDGQRTLF
ncbi:MAG: three-Cys-motif partner protein TcmP [Rikenellaceae bacterium]|nr:three-Cys-motif partner protein TcmP [Rikenellaceae bacterium]MCL2691975.1 three-Cys-motif partner protein TcmP [Rikenellaceae bacterium]